MFGLLNRVLSFEIIPYPRIAHKRGARWGGIVFEEGRITHPRLFGESHRVDFLYRPIFGTTRRCIAYHEIVWAYLVLHYVNWSRRPASLVVWDSGLDKITFENISPYPGVPEDYVLKVIGALAPQAAIGYPFESGGVLTNILGSDRDKEYAQSLIPKIRTEGPVAYEVRKIRQQLAQQVPKQCRRRFTPEDFGDA